MDENYLDDLLATTGILNLHFHCIDGEGAETIEFGLEQSSCVRKYIGPYSEAAQFARFVLGHVSSATPGVGYRHPVYEWLSATKVSMEAFGKPLKMETITANQPPVVVVGESTWPYIIATVTFESWSADNPNQEDITYELSSASDVLTIEGYAAQFASGQKFPSPLAIEQMNVEINCDMPRVDTIPTYIFDFAGKINSSPVLGLATGHVLFSSVNTRIVLGLDGERKYSLRCTLKWSQNHFNHAYNPSTGTWELVTLPGNRYKYQSADFSGVFN